MNYFTKFLLAAIIALIPLLARGQQASNVVVQGTITDKKNGETLIAVNVVEVDVNGRIVNATITDFNGQYVLKVKSTDNKLSITYIGFKPQEIQIGTQRRIDIEMSEDVKVLQETVIVADKMFGSGMSIPQREISTAVQTINTSEFEGMQVTSIDDALQGRIAGLDIVANSGDPGAGSSMRIRGTSSITGNQEPLIVVNGIPFSVEIDPTFDFANSNQEQFADMLSINPEDIEEVSVLKDAASTAIWGSKGANGVIEIKTKKGKKGPTKITYTHRLTRSVQPKGLTMLNGDDYTMMMKQAYFNRDQNEFLADVDELNYDTKFPEFQNFNNNVDWIDAVSQVGIINDRYLTVSGGGERARYRIGTGYFTQSGTMIGQDLTRYTSRVDLDYSVSDRLKFISEISFTYSDNDKNYTWKENNNWVTLLGIAYKKMPNVSIYEEDINGNQTGNYYNISRSSSLAASQVNLRNPVALANLASNNTKNYRILPTFRLQYDITDPEKQMLRYNAYVAFDINNTKDKTFLPQESTNELWSSSDVNKSYIKDSESVSVMTDNNITWNPRFTNTDHVLKLYGSFQLRTGSNANQEEESSGLPYQANPSVDAYILNSATGRFEWRSMAVLGQLHYVFKSKHILGLVLRRDGNTKFGKDNKWGNFPGISYKWIASDENFLAGTKNWLNMLAFRPSWGISGSEPDKEYLHYSRYAPYGNYNGVPGYQLSTIQLSDLRWAKTASWNLGTDIGFFDDKFTFDLNYYKKRTTDMLFDKIKIPGTSGVGELAFINGGTMDNEGWEVNFNANRVIKTKNFSVDFNFNISNNVNKIISLDDAVMSNYNNPYGYANGEYLSRIQAGNSYGSIYGFKYKGVYQYSDYIEGVQENAPVARDENNQVILDQYGKPLPMYFAYDGAEGSKANYEFQGGDAIYEDINHDGSIDELDIVYLGNSNPKFNGGGGSTIRYKKFACSMFFNFRYGNKIVNAARMNAESMYGNDNQSIAVNWRWRKDGDVTMMPRALYSDGYNFLGSDRFVEDGSFFRFKTLKFNYTIPKKSLKKFGLEKVAFDLTFNNVFILTKYTGVDPEVNYGALGVSRDDSRTPRSKSVTFGLTVGL